MTSMDTSHCKNTHFHKAVCLVHGLSCSSDSKETVCNVRDLGRFLGWEYYLEGGMATPLQYSFLEMPHGQSNLVDYSP